MKISLFGKTRCTSEETKQKQRLAKRGKYVGENNPFYGQHHSMETKQKYRLLFKGKKLSKETCEKMSISHIGQKHPPRSKEWREKQSIAHKGIHAGEKNPMYGKHLVSPNKGKSWSEEYKQKMSEAQKGLQAGPKNPMYGKHRTEEWKQGQREWCLNRIMPTKDTSIEILLQDELTKQGIPFEKHIAVCNICQPDILFPDLKIAVFADGDYWHSKEFRNGKTWEKDRNQERVLSENGWSVIRFWEHEINSNPKNCVNKIISVLGEVQ